MKRTMIALVAAGLFAGNVAFFLVRASAIPRYSARYEQDCNLCHVNPTGGGMRTAYASQFIVPEELAWKPPTEETMAMLNPELSNNVSIGADMRTIFVYSDLESESRNFFAMQGDIYLSFQMNDKIAMYFDRGMSTTYELYGIAYMVPYNGYVKVGRFTPAYGWRYSDHTAYTRAELGFFPPGHTDVGMEVGMYPDRFALEFSMLNGNRGSTFDNNRDLAATLRASYRFNLGAMPFAVGVSGYHNTITGGVEDMAGTFGYWVWRRMTLMADLNWMRLRRTGGGHMTGLVTSNELTFQVRKGLDIKGTWDFYDPDWNYQTGARQRFGGGVYAMPNPWMTLEALVRATTHENGEDLTGVDFYETIFQFHFLY